MILEFLLISMCNFQSIRFAVQNTLLALVFGTESSLLAMISPNT